MTHCKMKREDGPWIPLPSKKHLGQLYYFNVSTGLSTWERPDNFCESDNESCHENPSTPKKTENSSYIVESLSPKISPRKHGSREAMEKEEVNKHDRNNSFHSQRGRSIIKDHPYRNVSKINHTKNSANVVNSRYIEKDFKNEKCSTFQKHNGTITKGNVSCGSSERLPTSEKKTQVSYETVPRSSNYGGTSIIQGKSSVYDKYKESHFPSFDRNDLLARENKSSDSSVIYGSASLRLERLKKQLAESRLSKHQRPSQGKSHVQTSNNFLRDDSYGNQKKSVESPKLCSTSSHYAPLKNNRKGTETDLKRTEVKLKVWDWSSQKLVQDYNHKRIADCSEKSPVFSHVRKYPEPCEQIELKKKEIPMTKRLDSGSTSEQNPSRTGQSFKYKQQMVCLSDEVSKDWCSHNALSIKPEDTVQKCISNREKQYRNEMEPKNNSYSVTKTDYQKICVNTVNTSFDRSKNNSYIRDKVSQTKHKSSDSKGGISKINRKVQKQLRTAAPILFHLPVTYVQKKSLGFTSQREQKLNQTYKSPYTTKIDEEEEMDWEPIEPEKVVLHVEALRKEGGLQNEITPELKNLCNKTIEVSSQWFVVLDTNVLLSHLGFLRELRGIEDEELGKPTLFIPWVVLQELDGLKSTKRKVALQNYAQKAVKFLFDSLSVNHPQVRGQPKAEADKHVNLEPDDSILQCSLDLQKLSSKVLLLTNDRNLFNKAVVSGVECWSAMNLIQKLERRRSSTKLNSLSTSPKESEHSIHYIVEALKQCLELVLEEILKTEMLLAYDESWIMIVARKPPWTLNDIIFCLLKHWVAVFRLSLPSAARELLEKIRMFINNEVYEISLESVENMLKTCVSLMHLLSLLSYKQSVDNALSTLNRLQKMLEEQKKLHPINPSATSNTLAASTKIDDEFSVISSSTEFSIPNSRTFGSQKVQQTECTGSIGNSKGSNSSRTIDSDSKIDAEEDCISLFASSLSEDFSNNNSNNNKSVVDCIQNGSDITHRYLNTIFEKVVVYCGMLCDVMGIEPCVQYQRPEPFPSLETLNQNILSYIKCVSSLLQCMEGILTKQPSELQESNPVLVNFYTTITESIPAWNELKESLLLQHVLVYCTHNDTRKELECGKKQFEQFQAVLNQALNFFMAQNHLRAPLPCF